MFSPLLFYFSSLLCVACLGVSHSAAFIFCSAPPSTPVLKTSFLTLYLYWFFPLGFNKTNILRWTTAYILNENNIEIIENNTATCKNAKIRKISFEFGNIFQKTLGQQTY